MKSASDFIGSAIGESEKNTRSILEGAKGKVLVIDEAYSLYSGGSGGTFKTSVIDTLVSDVQNISGADICILMLGYTEPMEELIKKSNPGLSRRFSLQDAFIFNDYSDEELMQILNIKLTSKGLTADFDAQQSARDTFTKMRMMPNFGNGGSVETLISASILRMEQRKKLLSITERAKDLFIQGIDFNPKWNGGKCVESIDIRDLMKDMACSEDLIEQFESYQHSVNFSEELGKSPFDNLPMCFRFIGPPGTGKTTVARKIGKLYFDLGVLATDKVFESSATDFVGQFIGSSAIKTREKMKDALGSVLFIDEAYRLIGSRSGGTFAKEALDEIVDLITKPEYMNKIVIVMAG